MILSKRLRHIANMVTDGNRLADIGTDHGFVPITLIQEGRIPSSFAMDINEGPLERASMHVRDAGLEDRISLRLSDGLEALREGEADTVLIAGMGGALTVRILDQGLERGILGGRDITELVLQPQSEVSKVRRFLENNSWEITDEDMVLEDGKFYPMMRCLPGHMELSEEQAVFGPVLLRDRHPVLKEYLIWQEGICSRILESLESAGTSKSAARIGDVMRQTDQIRGVLSSWSV